IDEDISVRGSGGNPEIGNRVSGDFRVRLKWRRDESRPAVFDRPGWCARQYRARLARRVLRIDVVSNGESRLSSRLTCRRRRLEFAPLWRSAREEIFCQL